MSFFCSAYFFFFFVQFEIIQLQIKARVKDMILAIPGSVCPCAEFLPYDYLHNWTITTT